MKEEAYEDRYADLPFKLFVAQCRREHTRRLSLPWYLSTKAMHNSETSVWRRQANRYAQWYAVARLGLPSDKSVWVSDAGGIYSGSKYFGKLPAHAMLGYKEPAPCLP